MPNNKPQRLSDRNVDHSIFRQQIQKPPQSDLEDGVRDHRRQGGARSLAQSLTGDQKRFRRAKDADAAEASLLALYGALSGDVPNQGKAA